MDFDFFVINLDKSKERWYNIKKHFDDANISKVNRVSGFYGKEIENHPEKELILKRELQRAKKPYRFSHDQNNLGSIGCYISHTRAWQRVLDSGKEFGIICEDDISFGSDFKEQLEERLRLFDKWDVLIFGPYGLQGPHNSFYKGVHGIFKPTKWTCLNCYAIKATACKYLLDRAFPIKKQIDWFVSDHTKDLACYIFQNPIVILNLHHERSEISHTPVFGEMSSNKSILIILVAVLSSVTIIGGTATVLLLTKYKKI
jgi:GR25 family glycosyltransferase involved in LPS biosynthesis